LLQRLSVINTSTTNSGLRVINNEALFLETADIQVTRNIDERPGLVSTPGGPTTSYLLSDRSIVLDAVSGISRCTNTSCWVVSPATDSRKRTIRSMAETDRIRFALGASGFQTRAVKAFGFLFRPEGPVPDRCCSGFFRGWELVVTELNGAVTVLQVGTDVEPDGQYFGFISESGIRDVVVRDVIGDGLFINWGYARLSRSFAVNISP